MNIKVSNMYSANGNQVPNQFIIVHGEDGNQETVFQSYNTIIAKRKNGVVTLDVKALDYSNTTLKYLKQFLNTSESKASLQSKIDNNNFHIADLNK